MRTQTNISSRKTLGWLDKQIAKKRYKSSLYEFFKFAWKLIPANPELVDAPHIQVLCDEIEKVVRGVANSEIKENDLLINVPPGTSKSTIACRIAPLWGWLINPELRMIITTFEGRLSKKLIKDTRAIIASEEFLELFEDEIRIEKGNDNKTMFENTRGGQIEATSTGANIIGSHFDLHFIDDPIDPRGVVSDPVLEKVNDYINKTLITRKRNKKNAAAIMIMQRLHEDDPSGFWLNLQEEGRKKLTHVCLPATDDYPIYPIKYEAIYRNGYLDPLRLDQDVLDEMNGSMSSREYAGQFGQQPQALEGNLILRSYLPVFEKDWMPKEVFLLPSQFVIDTASTSFAGNDPTGILKYVEYDNTVFLLDYKQVRLEYAEMKAFVRGYIAEEGHWGTTVYVEPQNLGHALISDLSEEIFDNISVQPQVMPYSRGKKSGKEERLRMVLIHYEKKRLALLQGNWNAMFIKQLTMFPSAKHDECVDLTNYAIINTIHGKKINIR